MENLFVLRGRMQELYAERTGLINKAIQFILALAVFYLINKNIGFMKPAASPAVAVVLAVICTFLPRFMTVLAASVLILLHAYAVSQGVFIVTVVTFLIMYAFYFRLTPKMAFVLVLTPIAFALKVPYIIPAAFALVSVPASLVAIISGTIVFYLIECMKKTAAVIDSGGAKGMMKQITLFAKQVYQSKELWVIIAAFVVSFFVVYTIKQQSIDHAWKIAVVAGAAVNIIVIAVGDIALGIHTSYVTLIVGSVIAIGISLILEIFVFSVDYARSEDLRFEDDEYYYFVKAVPKISVASPEKTIKRINEHQETEIIDTEAVRKKAGRTRGQLSSRSAAAPVAKEHIMSQTEQILFNESLKRDLELHDR